MSDIRGTIKEYILEEFLPGEDPDRLDETTELVTSGVLDSLATMKLVAFLEERFDIRIAPHETDAEHLNTLVSMSALVSSKTSA